MKISYKLINQETRDLDTSWESANFQWSVNGWSNEGESKKERILRVSKTNSSHL